jgi:hypothetical protein
MSATVVKNKGFKWKNVIYFTNQFLFSKIHLPLIQKY